MPPRGQHLIQVGRRDEVEAVVKDLERLKDGGSSVRFIVGRYGSGKSFFLHLVRSMALAEGFVTMHADLSPDRRLRSTSGHGRALFTELTRNAATRSYPEGGALGSVVERFVTRAQQEADRREVPVDVVIREHLGHLTPLVGGYDFADVVASYWRGCEDDHDVLRQSAVRWLRGEYGTRTDARRDLGVRHIIDDSNIYDSLKLLTQFVRAAGYSGLVIVLDEMVNLFTLSNTKARRSNYEQILRIVNDGLQGSSEYMGILMAGTPEFLEDRVRGLYSYEALETRLAENQFARDGFKDLSGPVIRLSGLGQEELYLVLERIRVVHGSGDADQCPLPKEALIPFMEHCSRRIGADFFQTPRTTIKAFVQLIAVLDLNPEADWRTLLGTVEVEEDLGAAPAIALADAHGVSVQDDLHGFQI